MNAVAFIQGAVAMGCIVAGIFFLRFWRQSQDRLFVHFAFAFWLLAIANTLLGLVAFATDQRIYVFVMRLLAFCIILYAIFEKNRRAP